MTFLSSKHLFLAGMIAVVGCGDDADAPGDNGGAGTGASGVGGGDVGGAGGDGGTAGAGAGTGACTDQTDFSSDPANCGECGNSCGMGACMAGVCQTYTLATLPDTFAPFNPFSVAEIAATDSHVYIAGGDDNLYILSLADMSIVTEPAGFGAYGLQRRGDHVVAGEAGLVESSVLAFQGLEQTAYALGGAPSAGEGGMFFIAGDSVVSMGLDGGGQTTHATYATEPHPVTFAMEVPLDVAALSDGTVAVLVQRSEELIPDHVIEILGAGSPKVIASFGIGEPPGRLMATDAFLYYQTPGVYGRFARMRYDGSEAATVVDNQGAAKSRSSISTDAHGAYLVTVAPEGTTDVAWIADEATQPEPLSFPAAGPVIDIGTNSTHLYALTSAGEILVGPKR